MQKVNENRLFEMIETSSKIGEIPGKGLRRLALSDKDKEMRDVFKEWCEKASLSVRIDDFGNIYARREGKKDLPPVVAGSHLDSQPEGGRFDGVLGVLVALEALLTMNDLHIETERPIEVVNFTNEEGARFEPPMLGSGGVADVFSKKYVHTRKDSDNHTLKEELERIGYMGKEENRLTDFHSFLELHIEQGPILENEQRGIGVVEGVQGITWLEVEITGEADHAGPTPMHLRKDALLGSAEIMNSFEKEAEKFGGTITVGKISVSPATVNCVPGKSFFTVDIRSEDDMNREELVKAVKKLIREVCDRRGLQTEAKELWNTSKVKFDKSITDTIEASAEELGYSTKRMLSGAGHDAKYINNLGPVAMIFLPSVNGKSHVPEELTLDEDIVSGANVLHETLLKLANSEEI